MRLFRFQSAAVCMGVLIGVGFPTVALAQVGTQQITPQSIAGDWHLDMGDTTLALHLSADARGALSGTVTPIASGQLGETLVLQDVQLSGNALAYKYPNGQEAFNWVVAVLGLGC
jgi:hypothetical protein